MNGNAVQQSSPSRLPPGPKGWPIVGVAFRVRRDPLGTLRRYAREYGDIVRLPVPAPVSVRQGLLAPGDSRILLNHPDWITQVLVTQHAKFHKSVLMNRVIQPMIGQGLLLSEGEFWRRQRRLAQPAFHRARINEYAGAMTELAETHVRRWRDGETRDLAREMMALTLQIAVRTLFGAALPSAAEEVGRAITFLMRYQIQRMRAPLVIPESWPTPKNRRARREPKCSTRWSTALFPSARSRQGSTTTTTCSRSSWTLWTRTARR